MVIVVGNGHGDTSSNPGRDWLHFHIALIPLGKVWIQLFFHQLWVNCRTDWVLQPWWDNLYGRTKTLNSNLLNSAKKIDLVSYPARAEGLVNMNASLSLPPSSLKLWVEQMGLKWIWHWITNKDWYAIKTNQPTNQPTNFVNNYNNK